MPKPRIPAAGALTLIATITIAGASHQQPERAPGTIREGVTAVLVDVVVRDKRGQPVRDLTQADFEVFEDGARQSIGSFTPIQEGRGTPPQTPAPPAANPSGAGQTVVGAPAPAAPGTPVTALVFHALQLDSQRRAVQAALAYVGDREESANYIGVFWIDLTLRTLVPFTRNAVAARQALEVVARGAPLGSTASQAQIQPQPSTDTPTSIPGSPPAAGPDAQLQAMAADMIAGFQRMERDQQGYSATDALSTMVATLGRLPGRKSIVLFSEGLQVPPAVHRLFLGVIDAANRANVSIYTIDAAGLRTQSGQRNARDGIVGAGAMGAETGYAGETNGARPLTQNLEANEYFLRSDPRWSLGTLAEDTGGMVFDHANNLRPAFERIDTDLRNYYMLGYTPTNRALDGRFRTIQVKVKRPGVTVAARKGYFAVRNPGNQPLNAWEAPALGALEEKPVPNAFPLRAAALQFPERGRPGLVPVVAQVPTAPLTFQATPDGKSYSSDFTVLVRFLDRDNQVVRKVSQHYEIRGELSQIEGAKRGQVLFYRESELAPGVYSMETVVHDALSGKSSARFSTVEIPRYEEGRLRMSSLVLVTRGEEVAAKDRQTGNPLLVNGVALQPNLSQTVSRSAREATFYFAIYPAAGAAPGVLIQLVQNGKLVTETSMNVPAADASGRLQQLGRLPVSDLPPGTYELRALVKQGAEQLVRTIMVTVTE
jgi:VWFA-related protein